MENGLEIVNNAWLF